MNDPLGAIHTKAALAPSAAPITGKDPPEGITTWRFCHVLLPAGKKAVSIAPDAVAQVAQALPCESKVTSGAPTGTPELGTVA